MNEREWKGREGKGKEREMGRKGREKKRKGKRKEKGREGKGRKEKGKVSGEPKKEAAIDARSEQDFSIIARNGAVKPGVSVE